MKFFYLICFSFLFSNCLFDNCNQLTIPQSDHVWTDIYALDDTLIFKNLDGELTDIFVTTDKTDKFTPCNKFELGPNQKQKKRVFLKEMVNDNNKLPYFNIEVIATEKPNEIKVNLVLFKLYYSNFKNDLSNFKTRTWVESVKDTLDVYLIEKSKSHINSIVSEYPHNVGSFYWSKEYGLVRYTIDGKVFELYEIK